MGVTVLNRCKYAFIALFTILPRRNTALLIISQQRMVLDGSTNDCNNEAFDVIYVHSNYIFNHTLFELER